MTSPTGNAVKHFLGSYRRQTVVNREGGYLRPRSGERSYDVFAVNCSLTALPSPPTRVQTGDIGNTFFPENNRPTTRRSFRRKSPNDSVKGTCGEKN